MDITRTGQGPTLHEHTEAPRKRRKTPPLSASRKALLVAYRQAGEEIPIGAICPKCGQTVHNGERHHLAGRRKAAFLFTAMVHKACHDWIHANPKDAEAIGLLWSGRNSKELTSAAATKLVLKQNFPAFYSIETFKKFSPAKE